jgi:hypothetical protein
MFDTIDVLDTERGIMRKGRIVKVQFLDEDPPNMTWVWIPLGNCAVCAKNDLVGPQPHCSDPRITDNQYYQYYQTDTCPFFRAGQHPNNLQDDDVHARLLDVMRAAGMIKGAPSRSIKILQNVPWTPANSMQAHEQRARFLAMARHADSGESNEPTSQEYDDWSADLEPITPSDGQD